ncbi:MAG: FkbM family methyltransferase [Lachnospiraceae bacterium]|nr:FkbM family methyltransferase [Lachnospiraceae bacterium]
MIRIDKCTIPNELREIPIVLFGAGYTGRTVVGLLRQIDIVPTYFVDDDEGKQGEEVEGIPVISYEDFVRFSDQENRVAVIMTSIYGKSIFNRIKGIKSLLIYELYDWYCEAVDIKQSLYGSVSDELIEDFADKIEGFKGKWADDKSQKVLEGICEYIRTMDRKYIIEVCTEEEQYFIPEVIKAINKPLQIIDAGAYEGELLQCIRSHNIELEKWYCFEADASNYECLLERGKKYGLGERQVNINKGLWDKAQTVYFENEGTGSKIVDYVTGDLIQTVTIDEYFRGKPFNFIKMDIEGAEYPALIGGINTIIDNRPILAVSIYHSMEDYYKIPHFLMEKLDNYSFYVRHHSLIGSETVLYAIPNENI